MAFDILYFLKNLGDVHTDRRTHGQAVSQAVIQADGKTERRIEDRRTHGKTDGKMDRQSDGQTERLTIKNILFY